MTGLKHFARVVLLTSLAAFGSLQASETTPGAVAPDASGVRAPAQYPGCCWIWHMGRYWCVPC